MDTKSLITTAKARFKHQEAKLYLQEKYQNKLTIASQGGYWTITTEWLAYLQTCPDTTIILDNYNNPVQVNSAELLQQAKLIYESTMVQWLAEWKTLESLR